MTAILSSEQIIGLGKQSAKGVPQTTPAVFIKYLEGSFTTEMDTNALREGGDDEQIGVVNKNMHREKFAFKANARPQLVNYILAWLLGGEIVTGAGDPFTHTITRTANGRPYLTIRRGLTTGKLQQLEDCKIEKVTIEGEAGKEITISVEGSGLTANILGTLDVPTFEATQIFMFYDGKDKFILDSGVTKCIKQFTIDITVVSQEGLQGDEVTMKDLQDLKLDIEVSATLWNEGSANWQDANYNGQTSIQEDLKSSNFIVDLLYTESVTDDRGFKITIAEFVWNPVDLPPNAEPNVNEETIAGIAIRPSAGDIVEVVVKNSIGTSV